ncbi:hypothetical protein M407DRAFT_181883 [Tulasnella calospora MUT 4182]|uniref:Uncharacterized protein n=1 Tax=Tulasnella calospora MUT 4182 TaxID=1051891 RepID=A0A0C3L3T0_9AGAM|nr:hypothetical protein M407DRAFT_181883 [Tulasnella calospora MUT 4182]
MLPSLSQGFDGATDPKAAPAAYLQQRRGSLRLPGSQNQQPQQQQPFHYQAPGIDGLGSGQPFHHSPQQPQVHGSPASLSRHFDPSRINERLASVRGPYHPGMDDGSSVSDFGSNNSGAPSPVPSTQSISGFSASSRPTSSAGSGGVGRDGASAPPAGETFTSSLQGGIPLPTPLQLGSFNPFLAQGNAMNDRTPGASTEAGAGAGAAGAAGGKIFPPYQNFENMNLDEQAASFAAAAKNASNNGTYGGSGTNSNWNQGQQYGSIGAPTPSGFPVLSAGGKERAINELKEFWSAFISEPLSAGGPGAMNGNNGHSLQKQLSMPSLKTPMPLSSERSSMLDMNHPTPRTLYPSSGHHSMLGMMFKPEPSSLSSSSRPPNNNGSIKLDDPSENSQAAASVQPPPAVIGDQEADNLRSYQEACLRRETPMLRLQARPKSRLLKSSSLSPQFGSDNKKLPGVDGMVGGEAVPMKIDGPSSVPKGSSSNVPVFAEPFPPDSKEARDWNHYRDQVAAATDLHQATFSASSRPSYKRLSSTTLGPENTKKARDDGDGATEGSDAPGTYHVSYPQPGYDSNAVAAAGGAHNAWMRQRSMSSPSSMRPHFDWQSFGSQRA